MTGPEDPFDPNVNSDPSPADYDGEETEPFVVDHGVEEGEDDE